MSISAERKRTLRHCRGNLLAALFTALFGAIYENYSHEVYSYFMIYAFVIPLLLGTLPLLLVGMSSKRQPGRLTLNLLNSAIATLTVGSVYMGVLVIYGTTNRLIFVYPTVGIIFLILCAVSHISKAQ